MTPILVLGTAGLMLVAVSPAAAQTCQPAPVPDAAKATSTGNGGGVPTISAETAGTRASFLVEHPPDYVIGADDVLTIDFWRDDTMSRDVVVRPDGKISLPLVNDVQAAGLTPLQLCGVVTEAAKAYIEEPTVTITVKQINSRKVYIQGNVAKQGPYDTTGPTTILQLIAMAGGLLEFADKDNIMVLRTEAGRSTSYKVNYKDLAKGKNLSQNIVLRPGDIVIVR